MVVEIIAIVKPIKVRVGNLAGLNGIIQYIQDPSKTKDGALVYGKDIVPEIAALQMIITKKAFHKDTGRQYAHFIQSFNRTDNLTPEQAFEIGKQFISRNDKFNGFEVLMAVHTNEAHLHIHYVVNTVHRETGMKWQSSRQDLEKMRSISDDLCRENGLSVIENRGNFNMKYGEYKSHQSWKAQLAQDIAESIKHSFTVADFYHELGSRGIDCDISEKNIMFAVGKGYCGLKDSRYCSNYKLMPYGDYSRDNILDSIDYNDFNRESGILEIHQGGEILEELAQLDIFGGNADIHELYQSIVHGVEFKGKSWLQIQEMIANLRALSKSKQGAKLMVQWYNKQSSNTQILMTSMANLFEEFIEWRYQKYSEYSYYDERDLREELEL